MAKSTEHQMVRLSAPWSAYAPVYSHICEVWIRIKISKVKHIVFRRTSRMAESGACNRKQETEDIKNRMRIYKSKKATSIITLPDSTLTGVVWGVL